MPGKFSTRDTIEIGVATTGVSLILGAWLYVDSYFASAADLSMVALSLEQAQIQLRIDVLEDRIDREIEKSSPNKRKIDKMNSQIDRLEVRQEALIRKEMR